MSHIVALGSDRMYGGRCLNQIFRVSTRSHLSVPREGRGLDVLIITISMSSRLYVQGVLQDLGLWNMTLEIQISKYRRYFAT